MASAEPSDAAAAAAGTGSGAVAAPHPAEDGPFITAVRHSETGPVVVNDPANMDRARQLHQQLSGVVTTLNDKMSSVLKKQESEFLRAYRAHMYTVQKELAQLRAKADDAAVQLAKNERIRQLEAERDWYRTEALRLDQFCAGLKADVESMRDRLSTLQDDRDWLESQLRGTKRSNALLRAEVGGASAAGAAAGAAGGDAAVSDDDWAGGTGAGDAPASPSSGGPGSPTHSLRRPTGVSTAASQRRPTSSSHRQAVAPVAVGGAAGTGGGSGAGPRLRKGGALVTTGTLSVAPAPALAAAAAASGPRAASRLGAALSAAAAMDATAGGGDGATALAESAGAAGPAAVVRDLRAQLTSALGAVETLRAKNSRLKAANTALRSGRGELEAFFLQCVEDVRKEVARRRVKAITQGSGGGGIIASTAPLGGGGGSTATLSRGNLVASASAAALATQFGGGGGGGSSGLPASLGSDRAVDHAVALAKARHVGLDEFGPLDRRAVIARLLEDEFVLHALYGVVFKAHTAEGTGAAGREVLPPALAEIAQMQLEAPAASAGGDRGAAVEAKAE